MNVLTRIKILYTQDCGESPTLQPTRLSIPPSSQRRLRSRARKTLDTREATGCTAENMGIQSANQAKKPWAHFFCPSPESQHQVYLHSLPCKFSPLFTWGTRVRPHFSHFVNMIILLTLAAKKIIYAQQWSAQTAWLVGVLICCFPNCKYFEYPISFFILISLHGTRRIFLWRFFFCRKHL